MARGCPGRKGRRRKRRRRERRRRKRRRRELQGRELQGRERKRQRRSAGDASSALSTERIALRRCASRWVDWITLQPQLVPFLEPAFDLTVPEDRLLDVAAPGASGGGRCWGRRTERCAGLGLWRGTSARHAQAHGSRSARLLSQRDLDDEQSVSCDHLSQTRSSTGHLARARAGERQVASFREHARGNSRKCRSTRHPATHLGSGTLSATDRKRGSPML